MPRDNKTPLIQKIAKKANVTFKTLKTSSTDDKNVFAEKQSGLISLVTEVRAADLKIVPRKPAASSAAPGRENPPVTYMHICETDVFSMGVFLLNAGASIPLHDHPGMNGMLKVLYGKVSVSCYDKLQDGGAAPSQFEPPLAQSQVGSLRRSALRSVAEYSDNSGPCLLTPVQGNLHQIDAMDGPAAFLDILAPPYDPDDGRDCHYYKVLQPAAQGEGTDGKSNEQQQVEEKEKDEEVKWLLEVPQPEDFWCVGEPYPGPTVSV